MSSPPNSTLPKIPAPKPCLLVLPKSLPAPPPIPIQLPLPIPLSVVVSIPHLKALPAVHVPHSLVGSSYLTSPTSPFRHHHTLAQLHDPFNTMHDEMALMDSVPLGPSMWGLVAQLSTGRRERERSASTGSDTGSSYWASREHDMDYFTVKHRQELRHGGKAAKLPRVGGV